MAKSSTQDLRQNLICFVFLRGNNLFVDFIHDFIVSKVYQCFDFVFVIMLGVMFQCHLYEHAQHDITRAQLLLR